MKSSPSFVTTSLVLRAIISVVPCSLPFLAQGGELPLPVFLGQARSPEVAGLAAADAPETFGPGSWLPGDQHFVRPRRYAYAQVGQDFYTISGITFGALGSTVARYNATTNVWTPRAGIPDDSEAGAAAYFAERIYMADGADGANLIRIYDIAANSWSAGPARPGVTNSFGAAAGAWNGNVYLAGGGIDASTTLSIYNIASNTWSAGPAAPAPYQMGGHVQVGQFLYLIGGYTEVASTNSAVSMRLDMATNTWSTGPAFTSRRADFALAAAGSRLYAIGGDANGGTAVDPSALVEELDTIAWPAGSWINSPNNLPTARQGNRAGFFSTGRVGGEIWSTGGVAAGNISLDQHIYRAIACLDYPAAESTGTLATGAFIDIGNHCDSCVTAIDLPFPLTLYGNTFTTANLSSNGNLQFVSDDVAFVNTTLPVDRFNMPVIPFWDDLQTDAGGDGIFVLTQGTAPNRVFNLEWRTTRFVDVGTADFALRFFEGSLNVEMIYGDSSGSLTGTIGLQRDTGTLFTQVGTTNMNVPAAGTRFVFAPGCCAPITFNGAIGSNSAQYPGSSGMQTGRVSRDLNRSACGTIKDYPSTIGGSFAFDQYSFTNNGPATCVTFSVYTACSSAAQQILPVAYLGSFDPANIATNYLGDPGESPLPYNAFSVNVPADATVVLVVSAAGAGACPNYIVTATGFSCDLDLVSAASRKVHGFVARDIDLPLSGSPGVECRTGAAGHTLRFTFTNPIAYGSAAVTAGTGAVGPVSFSGNTMTVPLTGVTDVQQITVTLSGITDTVSRVLPDTSVSMNVLLGDTTGNRIVNASDIGQTKSRSGQAANAVNFRNDTTVSGSINASDIGQVKQNSGHAVP